MSKIDTPTLLTVNILSFISQRYYHHLSFLELWSTYRGNIREMRIPAFCFFAEIFLLKYSKEEYNLIFFIIVHCALVISALQII